MTRIIPTDAGEWAVTRRGDVVYLDGPRGETAEIDEFDLETADRIPTPVLRAALEMLDGGR